MEHTIKNGFQKCGLYPFNVDDVDFTKCVRNRLEELASHHKEEIISENDHDKVWGIASNIVIDETIALKNGEDIQNVEILDDVTLRPITYIINDEAGSRKGM